MGRRSRRRARSGDEVTPTSEYADPDGNVLTLRNELSPATVAKINADEARPGASAEDRWQRREELLFERLALRWEIAGLPLEGQMELLGRLRMADSGTRRWVRGTIDRHLREHLPDLAR